MFKKSVFVLAALAATQFANAQGESFAKMSADSVTITEVRNADKFKVETNRFWSNWFIGAGVGGQMLFSDHNKQMKFVDRVTPNFEVYVGKWFTPGLGVRLGVNGYESHGVAGWTGHKAGSQSALDYYRGFLTKEVYGKEPGGGYDLYKTKIEYLHGHLDVMLNLSQMLFGYNQNRFYSFIPYVGVGWISTLNKASNPAEYVHGYRNDGYSNEVTANVGLNNRFRLSSALDLNLDIRGAYINDRFDQQVGGRWGEGLLTATLGLSYNLGKKGWDRSTTTITRVNENVLADLRNRVGQLQLTNDDLRRQLEQALNREVTPQNVCGMPLLVTFPIDRWTISNRDRVNLGFLAAELKANPNMTYVVTGYADEGTGSKKRNVFLAQKRAEVIYDCLVKEFGVSENQLRKDSKGGVANMYYNDPRCSRAVLLKIAE